MKDFVSIYLAFLLNPETLKLCVDAVVNTLKPLADKFDSIAFRGMSGSIVAGAVAVQLNKRLVMIRKPNETMHTSHIVEGPQDLRSYVIIDDFIASGATLRVIKENIESWECLNHGDKPQCFAVVLYRGSVYDDRTSKVHTIFGQNTQLFSLTPVESRLM